jgi:hypothetical protein
VLEIDGLTYRSVVAADKFEDWFRRTDHYAPQRYEQLASVVQSQGKKTLAVIRYAGRERERSEASRPSFHDRDAKYSADQFDLARPPSLGEERLTPQCALSRRSVQDVRAGAIQNHCGTRRRTDQISSK